jgi:hypothetical protein
MSVACRALAEADFGAELEATRFSELYERVTSEFVAPGRALARA